MKKTLIFLILILSVNYFSIAFENDSDTMPKTLFYFGAYGAFNRNFHIADFQSIPPYPNCCDNFDYGTGNGFALGLFTNFELMNSINLDVRFGFMKLNGTLSKMQYDGNSLVVNPTTGTILTGIQTQYIIDSRITSLSLEPALNFMFFSSLITTLGFNFGILTDKAFDQYEQIISPNNVIFQANSSTRRNAYYNQTIPNTNAFQMSGLLGVEYQVPIGINSFLVPYMRYYVPFIDITSNLSWKIASLQIGAAVKLPFDVEFERQIMRDTVYQRDTSRIEIAGLDSDRVKLVSKSYSKQETKSKQYIHQNVIFTEHYENQIPKALNIDLGLIIKAVMRDGTVQDNPTIPTITIEEIETEEGFPLLPHVFFKNNDYSLNNSGLHLLSNAEAESFKPDSLNWNTLDIYKELLNITAFRLKQEKSSILTITGCNNNLNEESSNITLSQNRANAVKDYFTSVWGIEQSRIKVKAQNLPDIPSNNTLEDGMIENRRAELSSNNSTILKPVILKQLARTSNPPVIEIQPVINSDSKINVWSIDIIQQDSILRTYAGSGTPPSINWNVEDSPIPQFESPVHIKFAVKDIFNSKKNIEQQLTIHQLTIRKKRTEMFNDHIIEKYSLILFNYDKATINPSQKEILENIKSRIKPNSKVTIAAYTDRTGESDYNKNLALRRAQEAQKILKVRLENLEIKPIGNVQLLFDNSSPEGRSYSRTVQITIETPVEK